MTPEEVYSNFHSLKLHFNSSRYDFHKFRGKINNHLKPNDKDFWIYQKLSKYDNKTRAGRPCDCRRLC